VKILLKVFYKLADGGSAWVIFSGKPNYHAGSGGNFCGKFLPENIHMRRRSVGVNGAVNKKPP